MSSMFKGMIAGMVMAFLLGVSPAYALFGRAIRRTVMAAKTGTTVAGQTAKGEDGSRADANLEYLREKHRLDKTALPEK